jgi:hypothetical protein
MEEPAVEPMQEQEPKPREPLRSTSRNAGQAEHDRAFEWTLMNMSLKRSLNERGKAALTAGKEELELLFKTKQSFLLHGRN